MMASTLPIGRNVRRALAQETLYGVKESSEGRFSDLKNLSRFLS
jgi:hypothetical protein